MSSPAARKPIRIVSEESAETSLRWRVRTDDGLLRGPLSKEGLKALLEVGILTPTATIALDASESWTPFSEHEFWAEMKPKKREFTLLEDRVPTSASVPPSVPIPPNALETMLSTESRWEQRERAAAREREKTLRTFRILRLVKTLRGVREVLILAMFVILSDLGISFFSGSLEIARWMMAFGMIAIALMYYIFRALHD